MPYTNFNLNVKWQNKWQYIFKIPYCHCKYHKNYKIKKNYTFGYLLYNAYLPILISKCDICLHYFYFLILCRTLLTWLQALHSDLAEIDTRLDVDLDRWLWNLFVGEEHADIVRADGHRIVLDFEGAVLVIDDVEGHVGASAVGEGNSDIAWKSGENIYMYPNIQRQN